MIYPRDEIAEKTGSIETRDAHAARKLPLKAKGTRHYRKYRVDTSHVKEAPPNAAATSASR